MITPLYSTWRANNARNSGLARHFRTLFFGILLLAAPVRAAYARLASALQATITTISVPCPGSDAASAGIKGTASVVVTGGTAPYTYLWSEGSQGTAAIANLPTGTYSVTITDAQGITLTVSAPVNSCGAPATGSGTSGGGPGQHCTLTQGGYGNANGIICKEPAKRRLQLIADMLASSNVVIGTPGRSLTYAFTAGGSTAAALARAATAQCIVDKLPAGGTANVLPAALGDASGCAASFPANFLKGGRFNNVLIGQTLTLALNLRLDNTLAGVPLKATMTSYAALNCSTSDPTDLTGISRSVPATVLGNLNASGNAPTVGSLLALANEALGGVYYSNGGGTPSYSEISAAVAAINELFDNCRMYGAAPAPRRVASTTATKPGTGTLVASSALSAYPNPFASNTLLSFSLPSASAYTLTVCDLKGSEVARVSSGQAEAGQLLSFNLGSSLQNGIYLARLVTGTGTETIRLNVLR